MKKRSESRQQKRNQWRKSYRAAYRNNHGESETGGENKHQKSIESVAAWRKISGSKYQHQPKKAEWQQRSAAGKAAAGEKAKVASTPRNGGEE